jgi:hypothetical protein
MTTVTLEGFIARETEKAVAFVSHAALQQGGEVAPLWLPRKKISSMVETDERSASAQIKGERVQRQLVPVEVTVDKEFATKVGAYVPTP